MLASAYFPTSCWLFVINGVALLRSKCTTHVSTLLTKIGCVSTVRFDLQLILERDILVEKLHPLQFQSRTISCCTIVYIFFSQALGSSASLL